MKLKRVRIGVFAAMLSCIWLPASVHAQQTAPAVSSSPSDPATTEATRQQLLTLLRVSPTLTAVVASDPSLLGNQDYVAKTNPELAKFLAQHPEIARSPDFYLFSDIHSRGPNRVDALQRRVWTGESEPLHTDTASEVINQAVPMLIAFAVIGAFAWLIKLLLVHRRWSRVFHLQTDVHGKLIDRFSSSQELMSYMQTDAGKRFLEAAPISVDIQQEERWPAVLQRTLLLLTSGTVLTLLGLGLLLLRHSVVGGRNTLLLFGVVSLMPGLGCIIAAGVTWILAQRLGLMPGAARNEQ